MVLPLSFFEKANNAFYNSLVVIDADGSIASHYRKSHIPDGPGYQEKWYFTPGDTGALCTRVSSGRLQALPRLPGVCWQAGQVHVGADYSVVLRRVQAHQDKICHHRRARLLGPVVSRGRQSYGAPGGRGLLLLFFDAQPELTVQLTKGPC